MIVGKLSEMWIYPAKSCKRANPACGMMDRFGFVEDHRWMFINPEGTFLSQRGTVGCPGTPKMALIQLKEQSESLILSADSTPALTIRVPQLGSQQKTLARIHGDRVSVEYVNPYADAWASEALRTVHHH